MTHFVFPRSTGAKSLLQGFGRTQDIAITLKISWDLKSLVGTGDPIPEPCEIQSHSSLFVWKVQSLILEEKTKELTKQAKLRQLYNRIDYTK